MMTIYFKNGMKKKIEDSVGETIKKRIIEGCYKFQTFSDDDDIVFLIINLEEIVFID